jgi:hypothetical protein
MAASQRRGKVSPYFLVPILIFSWLQVRLTKQAHRPFGDELDAFARPNVASTLELALIGAPWRLPTPTNSFSRNPPSFVILQRILKDNDIGNITGVNVTNLPSCLVANHTRTDALAESVLQGKALPLPILNMGMPKAGTSTLWAFFECAGLKTNHDHKCGVAMRRAAYNGIGPLRAPRSCGKKGAEAILQMDRIKPPTNCFFPQIQLLDEIHQEHPNATFILNFRPVDDWINSARMWSGMTARFSLCDLPGLPTGVGGKNQELRNWYCGHVRHIREFVALYPSHALIELDLYDTERSARVMAKLFETNETCWGHANKGTQSILKARKEGKQLGKSVTVSSPKALKLRAEKEAANRLKRKANKDKWLIIWRKQNEKKEELYEGPPDPELDEDDEESEDEGPPDPESDDGVQ